MTAFAHEATVALADSVRALIDAVRLADAPVDALERARAAVDSARAGLDEFRHLGQVAQASLDGADIGLRTPFTGAPNDYFPYSPIVGRRNPVAPPVEMWADDHGRVHGRVTLQSPYNGPPGLVHGGVIALIFDELLGACAIANECPGFTGTLTVKYLRGTPLRVPLTMESWLDRVEGRKTFVLGELRHGDEVTASAAGVFIATAHQITKQ